MSPFLFCICPFLPFLSLACSGILFWLLCLIVQYGLDRKFWIPPQSDLRKRQPHRGCMNLLRGRRIICGFPDSACSLLHCSPSSKKSTLDPLRHPPLEVKLKSGESVVVVNGVLGSQVFKLTINESFVCLRTL
jgi:hypothetical protein